MAKQSQTSFDSLEAERLDKQTRLDARLSPEERNETGQFATPVPLADDITKAVAGFWNLGEVRFFEPAVGTGTFFSSLLRTFPAAQIVSALGVELDSAYADVAHRVWGGKGLRIINADFTRLTHPSDEPLPNLILTNPPYVRHHHLESDDKSRLQKMAAQASGGAVSGLSGLYMYFVLAAHDWLADDGIGAWLIPSEFMDVNYGEALRRYLSQKVTLLQIHRFDPSDVQFADALVSSAVVIFRRRVPPNSHLVRVSHGGSVTNPEVCTEIPVSNFQRDHKWSRFFNGSGMGLSAEGSPLSLLFTIKRGIATGANDFFILSRRELAERRIHERFVKPILPSARLLENSVIESDSSGFPLIDDQLAVIDTDLRIDEIKRSCVGLWRYLREGEEKQIPKAYLLTKRSPWYRQEQRQPAPFLCTYMAREKDGGRTFRFFWNRSAAIAANTYLLLYPIGPLKQALRNNPSLGFEVLRLLDGLEPESFAEQGRVYGGGLFKMEPRELGRVNGINIIKELHLAVTRQPRLLET